MWNDGQNYGVKVNREETQLWYSRRSLPVGGAWTIGTSVNYGAKQMWHAQRPTDKLVACTCETQGHVASLEYVGDGATSAAALGCSSG